MDSAVSRRKFAAEVARLKAYIAERRPGFEWKLVEAAFPRFIVDMPAGNKSYRMRIYANEWDARPASYRFIDPADDRYNTILPAKDWPKGGTPFLLAHMTPGEERPIANRPFICLPGTREYHAHKSHQNTPWEPLRGDAEYSFTALLIAIQNRVTERVGFR